jgi:branched-chain amino acid transport system substrate-binding protein
VSRFDFNTPKAMAARVAVAFCCLHGLATAASADITIGVAVPSSGLKSAYGATLVAAANREVERFNAAGGINGQPIALVLADDECTAEGGARVAAKFLEQRIDFVIGHPCSNAATAAAKLYAAATKVFVAIGARHPDVLGKLRAATNFRLGGNDADQARDTAGLMIHAGWRKIAIIQDRTAYARALTTGIAAELKKTAGTDVTTHGIVAGEKDYTPIITAVVAANVDAVYFAGFPIEGAVILRQLRAAGSQAKFIGSDALNDKAFAESAGNAVDGAMVVTAATATDAGPLVKAVFEALVTPNDVSTDTANNNNSETIAQRLALIEGTSFKLKTLTETPPNN